jgi:hypothetical protein
MVLLMLKEGNVWNEMCKNDLKYGTTKLSAEASLATVIQDIQ